MEELSLCVLCCYSFPKVTRSPTSEAYLNLENFIQNSELFCADSLTPNSVLGAPGISLCTQCLSGVVSAVRQKEKVDEMQAQARQLQSQLLYLLKNLRVEFNSYLEEVFKLQGKISSSDDYLVEEKIREYQEVTPDTVFCFRTDIMNSSVKLKTFWDEIMTKFDLRHEADINESTEIQNTNEHKVNDELPALLDLLVKPPTPLEHQIRCLEDTNAAVSSTDLQANPISENINATKISNDNCPVSYNCPMCPTTCASLADITKHLYNGHELRGNLNIATIENRSELWDCPFCGKVMNRKLHLDHMSSCRKSLYFRDNVCDACGKTCRNRTLLHIHRYLCPELPKTRRK